MDRRTKYDKANTRMFTLKLNRTTDADILQQLEDAENKQGYIKQALRAASEQSTRPSFENFKSALCHQVKEKGELPFLLFALNERLVEKYWFYNWLPEMCYTLAMIDYLSRKNQIPLVTMYDSLRQYTLPEPLFPASVLAASSQNRALENAIPEFLRHNIVEGDIENVV